MQLVMWWSGYEKEENSRWMEQRSERCESQCWFRHKIIVVIVGLTTDDCENVCMAKVMWQDKWGMSGLHFEDECSKFEVSWFFCQLEANYVVGEVMRMKLTCQIGKQHERVIFSIIQVNGNTTNINRLSSWWRLLNDHAERGFCTPGVQQFI